jgi:hypothetical protein
MTEDQELELFTIKTKFFREIPHPKLILKAINQVEKLLDHTPLFDIGVIDFGQADLTSVLKSHSDKIFALKTAIAHAEKPEELFLALNELYQWHWALILRMSQYLPEQTVFSDEGIKQSDPVDSYAVLTFIKSTGLPENQIKTYICNELETTKPDQFSILTKRCIQCRKIVANGGANQSSERTAG